MGEKLTKSDVEKIQKEIEHRKLVVRPQALEDARTLLELAGADPVFAISSRTGEGVEALTAYLDSLPD